MSLFNRALKRVQYFLKKKAVVLSYHRVANCSLDPWEISVSPANFEEHLQVLKKYHVITPAQLLTYLSAGKLKNNMVCITFDDGYQDNYTLARPLLEKYNLRSTIFIPTQYIGRRKEFWWDELLTIILGPHNLPEKLSISIANKVFEFDLGESASYSKQQHEDNISWIWYEEPKTKRAELYLKIWQQLRPLKNSEINQVLDNLRQWSSFIKGDESSFPMTEDQLNTISNHPLFDIGVHTVTHPALAYHTKQEQFAEISVCKKQLEAVTGRNMDTIAYPYGIYNEDTMQVAKELGLKLGFTTEGRAVQNNDHPLKLARCHAKNWNGSEFEKKLRTWSKGF